MRSLILVRVDNFPGSVKYDVKREARDLCNSLGCRAVSIGMNIKKGTVYITFEEDDAYTFSTAFTIHPSVKVHSLAAWRAFRRGTGILLRSTPSPIKIGSREKKVDSILQVTTMSSTTG